MTRPSSPPRSPEWVLACALVAAALTLAPARARAQACCAGGAVVTPTRLAVHEDVAAGVQVRARSNTGSFGADGRYTASGGVDQVLEQDVAASLRVARRAQVGVLVPFIQTRRSETGIDDWGGGIGDVALTGRYDCLLATESLRWPGIGLLAGVTAPTGTPPDEATHPLAADATGAGTFDASLGLSVEEVSGHLYGAVDAWLTQRFARTVSQAGAPAVREAFGMRGTAQIVGGWVFENEAALGVYVLYLDEGAATIDGALAPGSGLRLTTAGFAGVLPLRDTWRLQGSVSGDVPISSLGRNELAGWSVSASLVRVWM
jgi:hypothetical protein